jgi:hypothetical protein
MTTERTLKRPALRARGQGERTGSLVLARLVEEEKVAKFLHEVH